MDRKTDKASFDILSFIPCYLFVLLKTVLLYYFKGFILEIKTRQYKGEKF